MAKILLVEDDKSLREIYGVRLKAEGYDIVSAGDGEEALAVAIKERPDLIVSDVMMPKISGFDMLDILRSTTETKSIKVIMMTALSSEDQRARGESLGADRYLVKSQVGIEDVVRTVHEVLGDGIAAPAAPSFPSAIPAPAPAPLPEPAPAPIQAPIQPVAAPVPEPTPVATFPPAMPMPAPTPVVEPAPLAPAPVAPLPQPVAALAPAPVLSAAPVMPSVPVAAPTPVVEPAPAPQPVAAPTPAPAPSTLPEPTAPFSSPRPASLGDRVINPISPLENLAPPNDIAAQMNAELNGGMQPAPQPQQQPPVPPVPPAPGSSF
jgi:CheY-like chemotaxis protein